MDFANLIQELIDAGKTQIDIKTEIGCSQSTISDILNGNIKNPKFHLAQAIIDLHRRIVSASNDDCHKDAA